jgi:hypothetical protein
MRVRMPLVLTSLSIKPQADISIGLNVSALGFGLGIIGCKRMVKCRGPLKISFIFITSKSSNI